MSSEKIKENIIKEINKLPEESLKEINDFVSFILAKSNLTGEKKKNTSPHVIDERVYKRKKKHALPTRSNSSEARRAGRLDLSKDPLLKYIGSIEHGSLAGEIDKELYGQIE